MTSPYPTSVGTVPTADVAVPEHARELEFYSRVLTTGEHPLWREDLMSSLGTPIIGLGETSPEYADLPLQWMPHIQVADVAASAEAAVELGGQELMHHRGSDGASQWAVLVDPAGAAFGVIPAGASPSEEPSDDEAAAVSDGRIAWLDLTVTDAPSIRDFYRGVVGWSVQEVEMEDESGRYADYALCTSAGTAVAGVCHARGVNQGIPPVWLICLPVGDLAESLTRVTEGGGRVAEARRGAGGEYQYAVIRDPVGVYFGLVPG